MFVINFMIILTVVSVLSVILWNYLRRGRHMGRWILGTVVLSAAGAAILSAYSQAYSGGSSLIPLLHAGALGSVSWFLLFMLVFPVLLAVALPVTVYRLITWWKRSNTTGQAPAPAASGMSRRDFLKGAMFVIPAAGIATSALGNVVGEEYLSLTKEKLSFPDLPDYLEGYRIGQLSDTHIGLFFSTEDLETSIRRVAAEKVNRLEITGDLIDEISRLPECRDVLNRTASLFPDGIDFCYGNHEYYRGLAAITAMLEETPVRILRNSHFCASPGGGKGLAGCSGNDQTPFYIAGADFSFAPVGPLYDAERKRYMEATLAGIPDGAFTILLAHHPDFFDEAFARHLPLTMSGHTHGAQFAPIGPIVQAVGFKYLRGLYQQGNSYGYVNRGTGHWLPFRVLCSREVTVYELTRT